MVSNDVGIAGERVVPDGDIDVQNPFEVLLLYAQRLLNRTDEHP
jgi:hypothetical protein